MNTPEFPPNSEISKSSRSNEKIITPVVSGGAARRKKSLRKQFSETFVAGDAKTAIRYGFLEVFMPSSRDMVYEVFMQVLERLMYGGDGRRRGSTRPQAGNLGYVAYNRYSAAPSRQDGPQRVLSRQARSKFNFDEIVIDDRVEAEEVIDQLHELVSRYDSATVADLYELVGLTSTHTDHRWGWKDLHGSGVSRVRGGFLLDLPEPEPLD